MTCGVYKKSMFRNLTAFSFFHNVHNTVRSSVISKLKYVLCLWALSFVRLEQVNVQAYDRVLFYTRCSIRNVNIGYAFYESVICVCIRCHPRIVQGEVIKAFALLLCACDDLYFNQSNVLRVCICYIRLSKYEMFGV